MSESSPTPDTLGTAEDTARFSRVPDDLSSRWFWGAFFLVLLTMVASVLHRAPLQIKPPAWTLQSIDGNIASIQSISTELKHVRLEVTRAVAQNPWDLAFGRHLQVMGDHDYLLSFEGRADAPSVVDVNLREFHPPWENLGLFQEIELKPDWQSFQFPFRSTGQSENAFVAFQIGRNPTSVEIRGLRLTPVTENRQR